MAGAAALWPPAITGGFGLALGAALVGALALAGLRPQQVILHARAVLAAIALLTVVATSLLFEGPPLAFGIRIDPSTTPLLPSGDPAGAIHERAVLEFGDDEIYAIALECDEVFTEACLGTLKRISDRLAHIDGLRSVSSLMDVTSFRYVAAEDWVEIRPFVEEVPNDDEALLALRRRALADPVYRKTLVAEDAKAAALNLGFREMDDARFIASGIDERIRAVLDEEIAAARAAGGPTAAYVAGRPHAKVRVYHGILRDLRILIPLALCITAGVLFLFFGRWHGVLLPLGIAVVANLWTFGTIGALDLELTLLTGLLSPMLLALGCVYGVHVMARYEEEALTTGPGAPAALRCLEHIRAPALIAGATTVIGFAALLVSDVPAVVDFGLFSMLGVASATALALTAIPAALTIWPPSGAASAWPLQRRLVSSLESRLDAVAGVVARRSRVMLAGWAVAGLLAAALLPAIVIDTDYLSYFAPDSPVRRDFEAINRLLAGTVPLYVMVDGDGPGAFREPARLEAMAGLQRALDALPGVSRTLSVLDTLRKLNRAFHADDPAMERIPETRAGTTELLFMLPKGESGRFLTLDHGRANIILRTGELGSAAVLALAARIESVIAAHPQPGGAAVRLSGNALLLARSADGIARSQPLSVAIAALAIFALISLGLGSPRLGALAMIPNLIPVLLFFGLLGLGLADLSLPTSLIGSIALGIAIDDTVHFLARYRAERGAERSPVQAARLATRCVGRPIVITSAMLCAGFAVLAGSAFAPLQHFGLLSALTMALCLGSDLVLLPALLVWSRQ